MEHPIMKCGHAANSMGKPAHYYGESIPACAICSCFEIAEIQPSLIDRKARCVYYGQSVGRRGSCDYPKSVRGLEFCSCEANSNSSSLPFFEYHPDKEFDSFYCGCAFGWD